MKVEYRNDLQKNYLVFVTEYPSMQMSYDLRMITENQIDGLLPCERKLLNNDVMYYYDVTSQSSLEERCKEKKIQGQEILLLLNKILGILDLLEEYLLSEKSLCILAQYIYIDDKMEHINFCYVPGENWDFQTQLRDLMEYLLPYLDHANQESMMIGYGMYHYILREKFTVEGVYTQLNLYRRINRGHTFETETEQSSYCQEYEPQEERKVLEQDIWSEDVSKDLEVQEEQEHKSWKSGLIMMIGILWGLSGWFLWRNFRAFLWIWGLVGVGFVILCCLLYLKKRKKKTEQVEVSEVLKPKEEIEAYTQVLNLVSTEKTYVLKNESHSISLKDREVYIIGRDKNASDITLASTTVSRKHAKIRLTKNGCFLADLNSKNGIRVNGMELAKGEEIELFGGEFIQFADVSYYFQREN